MKMQGFADFDTKISNIMKRTIMIALSLIGSIDLCFCQPVKTIAVKNVTEFKVSIPQSEINELNARLKNTRWPGEEQGSDWNFGTSQTYLKELIAYWTTNYDWRKQE